MKPMKLIGMIHLDALPGYPRHPGMDAVIEHALYDAEQLQQGGIDAILIENTYDDPHQKVMAAEQRDGFMQAAQEIAKKANVPLGICALFNDYRAALDIAKAIGGTFVRIPVFTEAVVAACGIIEGNPYDVITHRKRIGGEDIKIYADVHVKHAAPLAPRRIEDSARDALGYGADALIVTGRYTGDLPAEKDAFTLRKEFPEAQLIIGSGITKKAFAPSFFCGVRELFVPGILDAAIVGTYLKVDGRVQASRVQDVQEEIRFYVQVGINREHPLYGIHRIW